MLASGDASIASIDENGLKRGMAPNSFYQNSDILEQPDEETPAKNDEPLAFYNSPGRHAAEFAEDLDLFNHLSTIKKRSSISPTRSPPKSILKAQSEISKSVSPARERSNSKGVYFEKTLVPFRERRINIPAEES